ncbi:MAG: hypothetical protein JNK82_23155 [Myxococcaceae bacterium]|nr:hypothetical protein [Myxococcaceae bacterium]
MTVHAATAVRPQPRTTATETTTRPPPPPNVGGTHGARPVDADSFSPSRPRCHASEHVATLMPVTVPDSAKSTRVLRHEAGQVRKELIGAALRGDSASCMRLGQRLGQLQQALDARGASMFPSNELSLTRFIDGFKSMSDDQLLGERSSQLQQLLVGGMQLNDGVVSNARERFEAISGEIDARGGLGLPGLEQLFQGMGNGELTSAVTGLLDVAKGDGAKSGGGLGDIFGKLFGGIFGGGGEKGGGIGDVLMGFVDPLGLIKGLTGGGGAPRAGQEVEQGGGSNGDRPFNGAMEGLMQMAQRGIGGVFQDVLAGLFK